MRCGKYISIFVLCVCFFWRGGENKIDPKSKFVPKKKGERLEGSQSNKEISLQKFFGRRK